MKKEDIRAQVRARKMMLDDDERLAAAERVFDALSGMAAFTMADRVLIYKKGKITDEMRHEDIESEEVLQNAIQR